MHPLLSIFRTMNHLVTLSLGDLTDEQARRRARGVEGPSITWTIGHLLDHRHKLLALLGDERPNPWNREFGDVAATDGAGYPNLAELRAEWQATNLAVEEAFGRLSADALDRPVPSAGIHGEQRVGDEVAFLAWHEGYHVGVIGAIRKAAGLPGPAELAQAAAV